MSWLHTLSLSLTLTEVDAIGGSSYGKMSTGASKRMTSDVPGNDGLNTIKVEGVHSH